MAAASRRGPIADFQTAPRPPPRQTAPQHAPAWGSEVGSLRVHPSAPEQPTAAPARPVVAQLALAGRSLQGNDAEGARDSLEAAETSVVFAPGVADARGNSVAAARITEALQMLEAGDRGRAMQCVAQALAALRPAPPS
jgi:hypothetical protein